MTNEKNEKVDEKVDEQTEPVVDDTVSDEKVIEAQAETPPAPKPLKQFLIESDGTTFKGTNINGAFGMLELQKVLEDMLQQIKQIRQNADTAAREPVVEQPPEEDQDG